MTSGAEAGSSAVEATAAASIEGPAAESESWIYPLRYRAQSMVRWFAPKEVIRGAYGEFFGRLFGAYADSRETQAALREPVVHHRQGPVMGRRLGAIDVADFFVFCNDQLPWHLDPDRGDGLTIDYVADVGDGFSSTFAVARQMAAPDTSVTAPDGTELVLPKGGMIVMGGDEVYPAAGPQHYRDRTIGPYRTAFPPETSTGPDGTDLRVPLFAIPGNHDWYDGLASFLERFTVYKSGDDDSRRRGWSLHQTRSYFAVQLTDRWWLWGIDIALNADIDTPQMRYFKQVAAMMPAEAKIVLCTGKPAWFRRGDPGWFETWLNGMRQRFGRAEPPAPDEWDRLTYFLEQTLGFAAPDAVRLVLTGDKHFYSRHEPAQDRTKPTVVVAGGGGAYLASSLEAPERLAVPWRFSSLEATEYEIDDQWPKRPVSRRIGGTALWRIPLRNPELGSMFGVIYTLFGLASRAGAREAFSEIEPSDDPVEVLNPFVAGPFWQDQTQVLWGAMHNVGAWAMAGALTVALFAMAKAHRRPWYVAAPATVSHMLLHGVTATASVVAAARLTDAIAGLDGPIFGFLWADNVIASWPTASFAVFTGLIGAGLGLLSFAVYLVLMQFFRVNLNELFVGMRIADYKHFVRLEVSDDEIIGHVVGFEDIPRLRLRWVDGEPQVDGDHARPLLIDQFSVRAEAATTAADRGGRPAAEVT